MTAFHALSLLATVVTLGLLAVAAAGGGTGPAEARGTPTPSGEPGRDLSHEQTLRWIREHRAWRRATKTKPLWARPVSPEEVGKEFQTADRAAGEAREGYMLCVGVAGEPWFQTLEKLDAKYHPEGEVVRKAFAFDTVPRDYRLFRPTGKTFNWVARVEGPGIRGFSIAPAYDPSRPLYSPAGGYVVKDDCPDPYNACPDDVWLVQPDLFRETYELTEDGPC